MRDGGGRVTSLVRRTVLPSGLRIVTEQLAGVRSASIGVWVGVGSRDETATLHGCSHFLEHLLFKGTGERSALDISIALDAVGGEFNAFTAKEYTCFHARVLDSDLPLAIDVLGDMITSSLLTGEDVEAERDVILDEIAMHDDDPDDVAHNLFAEQAWGSGTPLGRSIAGTVGSIESLSRAQVHRFYRRHYRPENIVIAAAGNLDHAEVVRRVQRSFGRAGFLAGEAEPIRARHATGRRPRVHGGLVEAVRPFEQVNLVLGMEGTRPQRRPPLRPRRAQHGARRRHLEPAVPGGPRASRPGLLGLLLRQPPRRLRASWASRSAACPTSSTTSWPWCAPSCPGSPPTASPPTSWTAARVSCAAAWCSGLEDSGSRMSRLGKAELVHDELLSIDEVMARIDAVTLDEVREVARRGLQPARDPRVVAADPSLRHAPGRSCARRSPTARRADRWRARPLDRARCRSKLSVLGSLSAGR